MLVKKLLATNLDETGGGDCNGRLTDFSTKFGFRDVRFGFVGFGDGRYPGKMSEVGDSLYVTSGKVGIPSCCCDMEWGLGYMLMFSTKSVAEVVFKFSKDSHFEGNSFLFFFLHGGVGTG